MTEQSDQVLTEAPPIRLDPRLIFDADAYATLLREGKPTLGFLKQSLQSATERLHEQFKSGAPIRELVSGRAAYIDQVLKALWLGADWSDPDKICLLAVGGYGRNELLPHSDIDLLILLDDDADISEFGPAIEGLITLLWDLNLDIGHSVRTVTESIAKAATDITIATNLLETRTLAGEPELRSRLSRRAYSDESWTDQRFFSAKRDEQLERHQKYGDTEYNLEPNIKTSPGTLRDIQTIGWITKRHFCNESSDSETAYDFLTADEYSTLREGEAYLWRLRYGLQMLAGRNENRLLFDHQRSLANLLGYIDRDDELGVEQMMQEYYRYAMALGELNDVVLQYFDEIILHADDEEVIVPLNRRFHIRNDYIEAINNQTFAYQPFALVEVFLLMAQSPQVRGIRANTIRAIRAHRHLIDDKFRSDLANTSLFMEILKTPHALHRTLSSMKRYGVLGKYLPEFGRVVGKMQHDLFHIYTVDAHTIHVIRNMIRLRNPESVKDYPLATRLVYRLPKLELLYIAGIYHDIAKGRGGDHSELGAEDVEAFCKRHHLSQRDTSLVAWLVRNHLLMSMTAQRKDPSDPEVIHEFASKIDSQIHLDYLYTLTVCDISATNPKLWNTWRAALLRQLYSETKRAIRRGLDTPPDRSQWVADTQTEAREILHSQDFGDDNIDAIWDALEEEYFLQDSTGEIAWQTAAIIRHGDSTEPLVLIRDAKGGEAEGFMQIMVYQRARDDLFAATTATLEQLRLNIAEARINCATDRFSLGSFVVSSADADTSGSVSKKQISQRLERELSNPEHYPNVIKRRTPRQLKHFYFPTEVTFSNDTVNQRTVMEIITPDRPGLLARIGSILLEHEVELVTARIATLGERVEDVFVLTDIDGAPLSDPELCRTLRDDICGQLDQQNSKEL
ncbi:[protein-PII] uridylyltransferase [Hahella sp. KA22]|uniref:[protein-PII] uridylyltransferase n=1 Tax=Hahella sp. KA22 TaxID=1628392 RepID=UPI000FDD3175|nr:[protein-PII] uridylyltransferase [Hahella sp. KA22]AZZ90912.1 [protein-PII] uridylyltransferase [Hahella sp. KA22]QAY54282.1 [protein-PII] uridylyltransferase [Hahella sp. KA22]